MSVDTGETKALAVYGSLQPGGPNEHILARLIGEWSDGYVTGKLEASGWGAKVGYPGIRLTTDGVLIPVKVFTSRELSEFWTELDDFEGREYVRTRCKVEQGGKFIDAFIYELAQASPDS